jgi:hypothetical protein
MGRWMRRKGSRYGQWHHRALLREPARFNRARGVVAVCGLIVGRAESELEHSDDPSDFAERCAVCRALGPIPIRRR